MERGYAVHPVGVVRSAHADARSVPGAGVPAEIHVEEAYAPGLEGLEASTHLFVLAFLDRARRDLLVVHRPGEGAGPRRGVFATRCNSRPNPIGLHVAKLVALDAEAGSLTLDAIDALDGTPVVDIKPYFASIDSFPDAAPPRHRDAP